MKKCVALITACLLAASFAEASPTQNPMPGKVAERKRGTKVSLAPIPAAFYTVSRDKQVPADLLYSISLQESKLSTNMGRILPWPWTANFKGKGYRFKTRAELYEFCNSLIKQGHRSVDIGIAQVNWRWHSERFNGDLWAATDPWVNLNVAADYLYEHYQTSGDWWLAAGHYHHPSNQALASKYRKSVYQQWQSVKKTMH